MSNTHDPESLSILFDLFVASQSSRKLLKQVFDDAEIRADEYAVYSLIFDRGAITPTQVADTLSVPVTTVLDHVRAMEERGHISKSPNPADGRSIRVSLTPAGRKVHEETGRIFDRAMLPLLENLEVPVADVHQALRALDGAARAALERFLIRSR